MANQPDEKITDIGEQQQLFLLEDCNLNRSFVLRLWYRTQVEAGQIWQIFRDGIFLEQWKAGPHTLWNALWHKWRALRINIRIVHLHFAFEGRVKGPSLADNQRSAAGADLGCKVKAKFELPCKIADATRFLQYEEPLSVFAASLKNMVIGEIGKLPYDQFGEWATILRDTVQHRLEAGKDDSVALIGMKVEDVYVTAVEPDSLQDRSMMLMYQQVERVKRELEEAKANSARDRAVAESFAEQGSILNISPSILALQNSPVGKELIQRDADLRKLMVAAGLNPGVSIQPIRDPQSQLGSDAPSAAGYLNPPRAAGSSQPPYDITGQIMFPSGPLPGASGQSGSFPSSPMGASVQSPSIDSDQLDKELAALQAAGFQCAGRGQVSPTYDRGGMPIPGSAEWALEVYIPRINNNYITVAFNCPVGYPAVPPRVQVRTPGGGGLRSVFPNALREWSADSMLVAIVREIDDTTP